MLVALVVASAVLLGFSLWESVTLDKQRNMKPHRRYQRRSR